MIKKRLPALFLCVVICLMLIPAAYADGPIVINELEITYTKPVPEAACIPDIAITSPAGSCTVNAAQWFDDTDHVSKAATDTFTAGHQYHLSFILMASEYYEFATDQNENYTGTLKANGTVVNNSINSFFDMLSGSTDSETAAVTCATIGDVLKTNPSFPTTADTAWLSEKETTDVPNKCYKATDMLKIVTPYTPYDRPITQEVTPSGKNYVADIGGVATLTFNMSDSGVVTSIEMASSNPAYTYACGKYEPEVLYTVTNGAPQSSAAANHGFITLDKTSAGKGKTVTVTVSPASGYLLKSLSYNDGTDHPITADAQGAYTFTMPKGNVTVNAEFEEGSLTAIEITTAPDKVTYFEGDPFDTTGMVVTASYSNGSSKAVTDYTIDPQGALLLVDTSVTVKYTENGITRSDTQTITVNPITLSKIEIINPPAKTTYTEGEYFDADEMEVLATYSNGDTLDVYDFTISPDGALTPADTSVTVSYTDGGDTKTTTQAITVNAIPLTKIEITTAPTKTEYTEGESFDPSGMVVTATYAKGATKAVTGYTVSPAGALAKSNTSVTITYTENGVTKTATQTITVKAAPAGEIKTVISKGNVSSEDQAALMKAAVSKMGSSVGGVFYDIYLTRDGVKITDPKDPAFAKGVEIELQIPSGISAESHDFRLFHLKNDGSVEEITPLTISGTTIKAKATSFSPYMLASAPKTFTITATSEGSGKISPTSSVTVNYGNSQTFTFTPDSTNYYVGRVYVDDKNIGTASSYTFKNVTGNHTIKVVFVDKNGTPVTGDSSRPVLWAVVSVLSITSCAAALFVWKKKKEM